MYIATFYSHFGAIKFKKELAKKDITATLAPVPRDLSSSCGTCVRFDSETYCPVGEIPEEVEQIAASYGPDAKIGETLTLRTNSKGVTSTLVTFTVSSESACSGWQIIGIDVPNNTGNFSGLGRRTNYIGGGQMVHASDHGVGVVISDVTSEYRINTFYAAKRIVD